MKKIAVIFGGNSPEYAVSLSSAVSVIKSLDPSIYEISMIGIAPTTIDWYLYQGDVTHLQTDTWLADTENHQKILPLFEGEGFWLTKDQQRLVPDVLFPILHGKYGEDGCIQGLFELMKRPYVGCGVAASALCMNKWLLHQAASALGIKSAPSLLITNQAKQQKQINVFIQTHGFPVFIKPNEAGSSKGIAKITDPTALDQAFAEAFTYGAAVLLQKSIAGTEIGCGILGNEELVVGALDAISLKNGFFDFEEKYQLLHAKITVPAPLPATIDTKIKEQARLLYHNLGLKGLARIDFFVTAQGAIYLNEINTMPGFTAHSRYPAMMAEVGLPYEELLKKLLDLAQEEIK